MKVGLYQFAPVFGEVKTNLDRVASQIESIDCDLLVLPEFAMTGYQFITKDEVVSLAEPVPDGPTTRRLSDLARSRNMYLLKNNIIYTHLPPSYATENLIHTGYQ